jgi:uncharacterized membrane protein YcgQ (UPF0703/DUF1980 family)
MVLGDGFHKLHQADMILIILTEYHKIHILLQEAVLNEEKKTRRQIAKEKSKRKRVELAQQNFNEMLDFAKEHHLDF